MKFTRTKENRFGSEMHRVSGRTRTGAPTHLQLVVVRLAAAVRFLGRAFVGVKQETDAAVIPHLHVLHA